MPSITKRICTKCNKIVALNHKCGDKIQTKIYNKFNRPYNDFYQSYQWRQKRKQILKRDGGLCVECQKMGIATQGNIVHHIVELKDNYDLRLVDDNLETICQTCHNKEHGIK